jgi:hypothetical protein
VAYFGQKLLLEDFPGNCSCTNFFFCFRPSFFLLFSFLSVNGLVVGIASYV